MALTHRLTRSGPTMADRVSVQQTIAARIKVDHADELLDADAAGQARKLIRTILFSPEGSSDTDWVRLGAVAQAVLENRVCEAREGHR